MLRLSRIVRRTTTHRAVFCRQYAVEAAKEEWAVQWNAPQKAYISAFMRMAHNRHVQASVGVLGDDKYARFRELLSEISFEGAKDNLSIGRVLAFLSEHNIDVNPKSKAEETPEEPQQAMDPESHPHAWPNLMTPDPMFDTRSVLELPPTGRGRFHNRVVIRNHTSMFHEQMLKEGGDFGRDWEPTQSDLSDPSPQLITRTGIAAPFEHILQSPEHHMFRMVRGITHQTGKGKIKSTQVFTVVGNGDGVIGLGKANHDDVQNAFEKSYASAVRNMDFVDRYEDRTIWTPIDTKFGAAQVVMRPRPLGFGLRCGPTLHRLFRAAGISDISAKLWGSRNPIVVTQAALKMLQSGHNPLGKGNGAGGHGKRVEKGIGMRNAEALSRMRGRYIIPLRK